MNPEHIAVAPPLPPEDGGVAAARSTRSAGLLDRMRDARSVCRQMFGIPDYERYLAHAAEHHPGAPVLSRRDFCAQAIERKYGNGGARCC
jgi:uncharacterized short protein YbdD (DUF466 family)